ncbi:MAG: M23 family metallopeptidase [Thermodesulfobacteriota bacterium]
MKKFFYIVLLVLVVAVLFFIYPEIELSSPDVNVKLNSEYIGAGPFDIEISEKGKGLKNVRVLLLGDHGESIVFNKDYPPGVMADKISVKLDPKKLGISEGPAQLTVKAEDRSKIKLFSGNETKVTKDVTLDLIPPKLDVISTDQYLNHGGSGFVVYRASPDTTQSGVIVGEYFFPGYNANFKDENVHMAFFAYPYNLERGEKIQVVARDQAGNEKISGLRYILRDVSYRKSDINISKNFVENIMIPIMDQDSSDMKHVEIFLKVNKELRKRNNDTIEEVATNSHPEIMWDGVFSQLSNSKVEANFADERTYILNDEPIDKQYHLGYDLAVTKRYPIEAANNGIVVYADSLGIYGNTVMIDHGMGLLTLYSHMSTIDVKVGDKLNKDDIIGRTGETGLAAGDHLHYGIYINGVAVRPIEWWDKKWIDDNVMKKMAQASGEIDSNENSNDSQ